MSLEQEIQDRLLGITPPYESQQHYAAIFRASPDLAFATAYVDGYHRAGCLYVPIIEQLVKTIEEKNASQNT